MIVTVARTGGKEITTDGVELVTRIPLGGIGVVGFGSNQHFEDARLLEQRIIFKDI